MERLCIVRQSDAGSTGGLKNNKHENREIMKTQKKTLGAVFLVAILVAVLYACTKEKDTQKNRIEPTPIVTLHDLPVYYNGKLESNFSEIDYMPTRSADMELTSIVDTNGIYYFDQDSLFFQFCRANQMEIIYQNNSKLDLIHQKAIELGIVDTDDDTIPQAMADYWQSICGSDLHSMMEPNRSILIKLYDGYEWNGDSRTFCWPCWPKLYNMDDKTSSMSQYIGFGATVMCYKKWFGGTKRWFWLVGYQVHWSLAWPRLQQDDNQYSSYVCFLI